MAKFYTDPPKGGKAKIFNVASKSKPGVHYKINISTECSHITSYLNLGKEAEKPTIQQQAATRAMEIKAEKIINKKEFAGGFPF